MPRSAKKPRPRTAPLHVGVAGWDYPDWRGIVYPQPKPKGFDPVRWLARSIDLIEINSTFYRPATADVGKRWAARVEDLEHFRYTAKLWRRFTHERKEAWTAAEVKEAKAGLRPLLKAGKLDALLVQFPMSFKADDANREWLRDVVDAFEEFPLAIEVRHESWNDPDFYAWLGEHDAGFVNIDQPAFKKCIRPSARSTSRVGYVRVHGRNYNDWFRKNAGRDARYDYLYTPAQLEPWVDRAQEIAEDDTTESVAVVFNNHYKGQAVVNAIQFKSIAGNQVLEAPAELMEAYPAELAQYAIPADDPPGEASRAA
jgi:uncharacterized protein YecE (DUF72 family)